MASLGTLIFDGDCGFCRSCVVRLRDMTGDQVAYMPYQSWKGQRGDFENAVHFTDAQGRILARAAEAVFSALATQPRYRFPLWAYRRFPFFRAVSEWAYRKVSENRKFFSWVAWILIGNDLSLPRYSRVARVFSYGLMGLAGFSALTLALQLPALIGDLGILPLKPSLDRLGGMRSMDSLVSLILDFPTFAWISTGSAWIVGQGILAAALAGLSIFQRRFATPCIWAVYFLYLSLTNMGQVFTGYQWESLLLETLFLSAFFVQTRSETVLFALRFLLFRLMLGSGLSKMGSGDLAWTSLEALKFHWETQPLPSPVAWWIYQLPLFFHQFATAMTLILETALAFLILMPRRFRVFGFWIHGGLQVLILATGSYGYFNLLTLLLCLLLLDDTILEKMFKLDAQKAIQARLPENRISNRTAKVAAWITVVLGLSTLTGSTVPFLTRLGTHFWIGNSFGLFAVMTRNRDEIILEGSEDGKVWKEISFSFKPGRLDSVLENFGWVTPYQPRLDWQMWFAALGQFEQQPWLKELIRQILQGSPNVEKLGIRHPFGTAPPRMVRASRYRYHFTSPEEYSKTGQRWMRVRLGDYSQTFTL
ncbi:MAG: lipase maturation factor family protein [Bdellovibrionales bacterium]|nr:lipase maturation factor family protein [Bdellovibrionales bacterium]